MNNIDLDYGLGQRCEGSYFGEGKHKQTFYAESKKLAEQYDLDLNDPSTRLYAITKQEEIERKLDRENSILNRLMPERRNRRKMRIIEEGLADVKEKAKKEVERMDEEDWFRLKRIPLVRKFEDIDESEVRRLVDTYRHIPNIDKLLMSTARTLYTKETPILRLNKPDNISNVWFGEEDEEPPAPPPAQFGRHKTGYLAVPGHISTLIKQKPNKLDSGYKYTTNPLFARPIQPIESVEHWDPHRFSYENKNSLFYPYRKQIEERTPGVYPTEIVEANKCVQGQLGTCLPWSYLRSQFPEKSPNEFSDLVNAKLDPVKYPKFYEAIYNRAIQKRLDNLEYPEEDLEQRQVDEQRIREEMIENPVLRTRMILDTFNELKDVIPTSILEKSVGNRLTFDVSEIDDILKKEGYAVSFMTPEDKRKTYRQLGLGKHR